MRTLLILLILQLTGLVSGPAYAQHCGFDFSSIVVIRLEPSQLQHVGKLEAVLNDKATYQFWKNQLPQPGQKADVRNRPGMLDSNSYWFAGNNFVIAGALGFKRHVPVIVTYLHDRLPDTAYVSPEYIHSLCSDRSSWMHSEDAETRAHFVPVYLNMNDLRNHDTIAMFDAVLTTEQTVYRAKDTISLARIPHRYIGDLRISTDGACAAKVAYGIKKRNGDEWEVLWPLPRMARACGPGHSWLPDRFRQPIIELPPGEYKLTYWSDKLLETTPFRIIE